MKFNKLLYNIITYIVTCQLVKYNYKHPRRLGMHYGLLCFSDITSSMIVMFNKVIMTLIIIW